MRKIGAGRERKRVKDQGDRNVRERRKRFTSPRPIVAMSHYTRLLVTPDGIMEKSGRRKLEVKYVPSDFISSYLALDFNI